ncbi:maltose acetyltransferase domain-containing protein, partial [Bacillus thuringiensis]|uniref:maltose acetyltransferase domain-containing protein n=1 Tax=Bacillus thuringiensis TaxID=1428 RepID=UPI0027DC3D09
MSFNKKGDECMKTEKEKMVAGEMYMPDDEELVADRTEAKRLTRLYNEAMEIGDEKR